MFESKFCKIKYLDDKNAVLCHWKSYCNGNDYREPLQYGLKLINEKNAITWITDTTNGFESDSDDNQWLANEFSPQAINSSCQNIIFIIKKDSPLRNEIELHSQILKQFFDVKLIEADSTHKRIPLTRILASKPVSSIKAS